MCTTHVIGYTHELVSLLFLGITLLYPTHHIRVKGRIRIKVRVTVRVRIRVSIRVRIRVRD